MAERMTPLTESEIAEMERLECESGWGLVKAIVILRGGSRHDVDVTPAILSRGLVYIAPPSPPFDPVRSKALLDRGGVQRWELAGQRDVKCYLAGNEGGVPVFRER